MSEQELSPWDKEKLYNQKKLRKHEQKLRERLKEAQEEQAGALERLRRAEERMRKRMAEVGHLEERLNIVRQQMEALQAPHATVVTIIAAGADVFTPLIEAPSSPIEPAEPTPSEVDEAPPEASDKAQPEASAEAVVGPSSIIFNESVGEEEDVERAQAADEGFAAYDLEHFSDTHVVEISLIEDIINEGEMVAEVDELLLVDDAVAEIFLDELPEDEDQATSKVSISEDQVFPVVATDDVLKQARRARAVAEAAREAARVAIERAIDLEEYLEQVGSARHLLKELGHLQAEADQAKMIARETEEMVRVVESLLGPVTEEEQQENTAISYVGEEREEPIIEMGKNDSTSSSELAGQPSSLEVAQVEEIEEEEEALETVAAMIIADAAGIAAAQAEAEAEASSARTREARVLALNADQAIENVRAAIRKQKLSGEGAEVALRAAEREATRAHAALADAEVAEEHALSAAMNAEAEAEVAEGMAFATSSRDERDEKLRDENASR